MFDNRQDAGRQLAEKLEKYAGKDVIVLAIPRGGAEVGYEVAKALSCEFSILVARKLPFPDDPEAGFGAIAEDGSTYLIPEARLWMDPGIVKKAKKEQKKELSRRIKALRPRKGLPKLRGKTVILVDDGIAMGCTIRAAVMLLRKKRAKKIIIAAPVSSEVMVTRLKTVVDEVVMVETPSLFTSIATSYRDWYDVSDDEVIGILKKREEEQAS
jgi:putative phosphoribosyl transferase